MYVTNNKLSSGGVGFGPLGAVGATASAGESNWAVIEHNTFQNTSLGISHGAAHAMIRNNYIAQDNGRSVYLEGFNATFNRGVSDVYVINNVAINNGTQGKFLHVGGEVDGITLVGNRYYAVNEPVGDGDHTAVSVQDTDLSSFRWIDGNTWIMKDTRSSSAFAYVWPDGWDSRGVIDLSEWNAMAVTGTDTSINTLQTPVTFDVNELGITVGAMFA
jgi:hypothetical protein